MLHIVVVAPQMVIVLRPLSIVCQALYPVSRPLVKVLGLLGKCVNVSCKLTRALFLYGVVLASTVFQASSSRASRNDSFTHSLRG